MNTFTVMAVCEQQHDSEEEFSVVLTLCLQQNGEWAQLFSWLQSQFKLFNDAVCVGQLLQSVKVVSEWWCCWNSGFLFCQCGRFLTFMNQCRIIEGKNPDSCADPSFNPPLEKRSLKCKGKMKICVMQSKAPQQLLVDFVFINYCLRGQEWVFNLKCTCCCIVKGQFILEWWFSGTVLLQYRHNAFKTRSHVKR